MKKLVILLFCTVISLTIFGQQSIDSWRKFESNPELIKTEGTLYSNYIQANYPTNIPEESFGEYKSYLRYMYYWQRRLGIDAQGDLSYEPYYEAAKDMLINPICVTDPLANWESLEPGIATSQNQGLISEVLYDPNNPGEPLISSNHGGLWKFDESLKYWYCVTENADLRVPGIAASEIVRNPFNANKLYASTSNGIHKVKYGMGIIQSDNNGETWSVMPGFDTDEAPRVVKIVIDPNDNNPSNGLTMYAVSETRIYKTTNTGISWSELSSSPNMNDYTEIYDMEIDNQGSLLITTEGRYGYTGQCFKFKNNTWTEILSSYSSVTPQRTNFTTPHNGLVFALVDNLVAGNGRRDLYRSTNYGDTWQLMKSAVSGIGQKCEAVYSSASNYVYLGQLGITVYNNANNQIQSIPHSIGYHMDVRDINVIGIENGMEKIVFANDGGITYVDVDVTDMSNFSFENHIGTRLTVNNLIGIGVGNGSSEFAMAGGVHGNSLQAINSIAFPDYGADGSDCLVHPEDDNTFYHMRNEYIKSSKSGTIYHESSDWFIGMRFEIDPNNSDVIYFGREGKIGIYNESTQLLELKATPQGANDEDGLKKVGAIEKSNNGTLYISDYNAGGSTWDYRMAKSTNDGTSWTDMSGASVYNSNGQQDGTLGQKVAWKTINSIETNPSNSNEMWLCIGGIYTNNGIVDNKYRVLRSTNGGNTWKDYSNGLTAFPANYVYYHYKTEMLFVATDAGVFYRDPSNSSMTSWECFSNDMPMGIVTDLDASDCNNMLYASMDGKGMYRTPIPFPIVNGTSTTPVYESDILITGNEVWNTTRYFDGDIMIAPNATLRINDKVLFTENGSITVLPGGELYLAGIVDISEQCSHNFWKGIQLRGNANSPQTPQYQGAIRTLAGAEIRNAEIGIAAYGIDHNNNGNYIQNSQGGIVIVDNARFVNNKIGIEIRDYTYSVFGTSAYKPVVLNSTFATYGTYYNDPMETPIGIQILSNNNVVVSNCTFEGNDYLKYLSGTLLYPIGVKTWYSPTQIIECEFDGIGYGVHAMDLTASSRVVEIDRSSFHSCNNSIYLNGLSNPRVTRNELTFSGSGTEKYPYLLYIDECNNFVVEENEFTSPYNTSSDPNFGVIVNNCGAFNNSIYKNQFTSGYCGILAQNKNRDASGQNGLQIKCNVFEEHTRNNVMVSAGFRTSPEDGIAAAQGSLGPNADDPAGNLFSLVWTNPNNGMTTTESHFWNLSNLNSVVTYYHHNSTNNDFLLEPGYDNQNNLINGILKVPNYNAPYNDNSCASHFVGGGIGDDQKSRMASSGTDITATSETLNAITDAGDTEALTADIQTADSDEAFALRNELLSTSPYTSNEVLETATQKEEVLSNPLIRDVLVANPQSAKSEEVLELIDSRANPMPEYMKQQILNGQTIIGQKEELEAKLHNSKVEHGNALNYTISLFLNDTTIDPNDSIVPLLAASKNLEAHYQLAGYYLKENNTAAMNTILSQIPVLFNLSEAQELEWLNMNTYYTMLLNVQNEDRTLYQLNESEKAQLMVWYEEEKDLVSAYARNILVFIGDVNYEETIILPDMEMKSSLITKPFDVDILNMEQGILNVYPNPANDFIICEYDIQESFETAQIIITESSSAKNVYSIMISYPKDSQTIDLTSLKSGAYILSLKLNDKIISSKKFNIIK